MKAIPLKLAAPGQGFVQVSREEATHLKIRMPGPTGEIALPVIIKGPRVGTGKWTWNGDVEKPTLKPSVLTQSGHYAPGLKPGDRCWCTYYKEHPEEKPVFHCYRCHSWVNDGVAQFLADCTHELAGKSVPLLDFDGQSSP